MKTTFFWAVLILGFIYFNSLDDEKVETSALLDVQPVQSSESLPTPTTGTIYFPRTFGDYDCTQDCSGHEAGYDWAEENGIESIDDCGGNSNSFIEGCETYVEENYPEEDYNYSDDEYEDEWY